MLEPIVNDYLKAIEWLLFAVGSLTIIAGFDDLFVDVSYWLLKFRGKDKEKCNLSITELSSAPERPLAIMVPAWQEADVIFHMLETNISSCEYRNFRFFVGAYQNDAATQSEVMKAVKRHPDHVTMSIVPHDGPTCKADCLNEIIKIIWTFEEANNVSFCGIALHDSEDVIHPYEFSLFNCHVDEYDLIQLPIFSFERSLKDVVAGTYMDEFAEFHSKDLILRAHLTGIVPCAGVSACFSSRAIKELIRMNKGKPFNTGSLTEDYDIAFRMKDAGLKEMFLRNDLDFTIDTDGTSSNITRVKRRLPVATREYFPSGFRAAYRQRARWLIGIVYQGSQSLGWGKTLSERYFFLRDRKSVITAIIGIFSYFLLFNIATIMVLAEYNDEWRLAAYSLLKPSLRDLLAVNLVLLCNRMAQRFIFTARVYGFGQGLMAIPRTVVSNAINFCAALRATYIFVWRHQRCGQRLTWDKTDHTLPAATVSVEMAT